MTDELGTREGQRTHFKQLEDYRGIASDEVLEEIAEKGRQLKGATLVHVNATNFGGGVAEILDNLVLLMNEQGVRTDWRVLYGVPDFFEVTKKFHNALQGQDIEFSQAEFDLYKLINEKFAQFAFLDHDYVIIHDPQPCALVHYTPHTSPWVFRLHIDITHPNQQALDFLRPFILEYDRMVISTEAYRNPTLDIEHQIISPSIDPISPKNRELPQETIDQYLKDHGVPNDKPFITQVSRFDPWKDPEGVLKVFERVKEQVDCRLVFCYNLASDDPEGIRIYQHMSDVARPYLDRGDVVFVRGDDPILVNVLQRASAVILQKSTREGFGMTVTEAMWKRTPVVASNVGGIPTQIRDGESGYLVDPYDFDACAERVVSLLKDPDLSETIGRQAQERVRSHFLITRHLLDYFNLLLSL